MSGIAVSEPRYAETFHWQGIRCLENDAFLRHKASSPLPGGIVTGGIVSERRQLYRLGHVPALAYSSAGLSI